MENQISFEEVMFALAKITKERFPSVDYSKLSDVFKTIITPSKKAKKVISELGVEYKN